MHDLLVYDLQMLYNAEKLDLAAQNQLVESATDPKLKAAFTKHGRESEKQVARLEQIMETMNLKPGRETPAVVKGLLSDTQKLVSKNSAPEMLDAMLIGAAQKYEHYEIACYGTAVQMTQDLGLTEVAELLRETLEEEKQANDILNDLAKHRINPRAEAL